MIALAMLMNIALLVDAAVGGEALGGLETDDH
jgi:hypothetical protein